MPGRVSPSGLREQALQDVFPLQREAVDVDVLQQHRPWFEEEKAALLRKEMTGRSS